MRQVDYTYATPPPGVVTKLTGLVVGSAEPAIL